jgi:hypothetical protein
LAAVVQAKLAGEDKLSGIAEWIRLRRDVLGELFNCKHRWLPCLNIIRWVLQEVVSAEEIGGGAAPLPPPGTRWTEEPVDCHRRQNDAGNQSEGRQTGVHLLAAFLPAEGVVLRQVLVDAKKNEIVTAPELIDGLDLKNEDATRRTRSSMARAIAAINNFVIGLALKKGYTNLASARRTFNARIATQFH